MGKYFRRFLFNHKNEWSIKWVIMLTIAFISLPTLMARASTITIKPDTTVGEVKDTLLGTNLPMWVNRMTSSNADFRRRLIQSQTTLMRIPGGSWSNSFRWEECEKNDRCNYGASEGWIIRPTEFIDLLRQTRQPAIFTLNANITSKEAAALVAFFNGDVNDTRSIGIDIHGKDWGVVGDWAGLRRDNGNPEPFPITLWEFGNEVYGGKSGLGKDCLNWGWEDVWTCDGAEYVHGVRDNQGKFIHEGYKAFYDAMKEVDPNIRLGAVGIPQQNDWTNWGNEVIAEAGSYMDFYVVHQYAYFNAPANRESALSEPHSTWNTIIGDIHSAFDQHAQGRRVPIAVTEYNLFSSWDRDPDQWLNQAVNMLHLADTIGQMMIHGIDMATQWAFANGAGTNGSDYGLVSTSAPYARAPSYFVFPLWAKLGKTLLQVSTSRNQATQLSAYAGKKPDGNLTLLVINKTGEVIDSTIRVEGKTIIGATIDDAVADNLSALTIQYNNHPSPSLDIANAPGKKVSPVNGMLGYSFPGYSISHLLLEMDDEEPPEIDPSGSMLMLPGYFILNVRSENKSEPRE